MVGGSQSKPHATGGFHARRRKLCTGMHVCAVRMASVGRRHVLLSNQVVCSSCKRFMVLPQSSSSHAPSCGVRCPVLLGCSLSSRGFACFALLCMESRPPGSSSCLRCSNLIAVAVIMWPSCSCIFAVEIKTHEVQYTPEAF